MSEIDKITLEVEGKATDSTKGIDNLITKLGNLEGVATSINPKLNALSTSFRGLASAASSLSNINFNNTVSSMEQLGRSLNVLNLYTGNMKDMQTNLKGISSGINAMKRSMASLGEVAPNIQKIDMTGISSQIQELSKLGKLSESFTAMKDGAKAFNSSVNIMNKGADKFPDMMSKINNLDLTKFKNQVKELASAMGLFTQTINSTASSLSGFSKAVTGLPTGVNRATTAVTKAQKSSKGMSSSSIFGLGGGANLLSNLYMLKRIGDGFGYVLGKANNFIETMNLFGVVMGENTQKASKFQNQLQELGVDKEQSMRFQSSFYDIGKSLGMTSKNAYTLSEQFTKLGYDYSSLYNIPVEQSFEKLQSGIVGVVRPLRGLGKDISEAKLKETALTLGIQENVRTMAQSDKATLRFITLMRQSGAAMNDMERTLYTPANALRILKAQFVSLARELGNLFIPILVNMLPYLIAVAKFLRGIVADIAGFFGIKLFELDFSGINTSMGIADDYSSDMADNLNSGAQSAKQIKDYMLGIDELNVLNTDTGGVDRNTGAAGIGGGGGGALDNIDLENFGYEDLLTKIDDKSKGILATLNKWKIPILIVAGILGGALLLGKITGIASAFSSIGAIGSSLGVSLGWVALIIGAIAIAIGEGVLLFNLVYEKTNDWKLALAVGLMPLMGSIPLIVYGIAKAFDPSIEKVDTLGAGISKVTKEKLEPFVKSWEKVNERIAKINFKGIISDEDISYLSKKAKSMTNSILKELSSDQNEELKNLSMLQGLKNVTEADYQELVTTTNKYYENQKVTTENAQIQINDILAKYRGTNIEMTKEDNDKLKTLYDVLADNAVAAMSKSAQEQELILNRLKYNKEAITLETGSKMLVTAKTNYDQQISDAKDWKATMLADLDKKYEEEGTMTKDEYERQKGIISAAYGDMVTGADKTYNEIASRTEKGMGDQYDHIDQGTGKIKANWQVCIDNLASAWNHFISFEWAGDLATQAVLAVIGGGKKIWDAFDKHVIKPLKKGWDDFWGGMGDWWDKSGLNPGNWFGGGKKKGRMAMGVDFTSNNSIAPPLAFAQGGFVPQRASFVSPDSWTAGEEGKKELIGSYKGKTTVMPLENTSFVSTMYQAVYDAVRDASQENEINVVVQPKVRLDSRDIAQGQEEYKFKSGGNLIKKR